MFASGKLARSSKVGCACAPDRIGMDYRVVASIRTWALKHFIVMKHASGPCPACWEERLWVGGGFFG